MMVISAYTKGLEGLLQSLPGKKVTGQPLEGAETVGTPISAPDFFTWVTLVNAEFGNYHDDTVVAVDWSSAMAGIAMKKKGAKLIALFTSVERERGFMSEYSAEIEELEKELAAEADAVLCLKKSTANILEKWGAKPIITGNPGGAIESLDA